MQNKKNSKKYVEMLNIIFFRRLGRFEKELKVEWSEELMITKEMIKKGFETGKVSVETEYADCLWICCRIEDNAFYFTGNDTDLTKKEYWKAYTLDMTIDMIFDILKSVESAEENGIDCEELFYYEAVLTEIYSGKVKGNSKSITHV